MRITNNLGLPDAFVRAASTGAFPPKLWRHRVSQLTGSAKVRWFELTHWDELESDASERLWSVMGSALHHVLHQHCGSNEIAEERLTYMHKIDDQDVAISGQADLLTQIGPDSYRITDWKFCKIAALSYDKTSWLMQLRCYAWLYSLMGFPVKEAELVLILRNREAFKAIYTPDYPQSDIVRYPVDLWDFSTVESWSREMSHRLVVADKLVVAGANEEDLPLCTDEERWYSPSRWAVKKARATRASRVFRDEAEAVAYMASRGKPDEYGIDFRPGRSTKCHWCAARSICQQWAAQKVLEAVDSTDEEGDDA